MEEVNWGEAGRVGVFEEKVLYKTYWKFYGSTRPAVLHVGKSVVNKINLLVSEVDMEKV